MARPEPPHAAPDGFEHVAVVDKEWRLVTGKRCRLTAKGRRACGQPSVAEFNRSHFRNTERWWAYCADHLYGRWIEDGQVMHWVLRKKDGAL